MPTATMTAAQVAEYALQIDIAAPPERVWRGLTDQVHSWWLPDFHALGEDSEVTLDATAGGHLVERQGERSLLWFTVLAVAPNESISLSGQCTPEWGGPYSTLLTLKLEATAGGTRLHVTDALYGHVGEKQVNSLSSGWQRLFGDGLKKALES